MTPESVYARRFRRVRLRDPRRERRRCPPVTLAADSGVDPYWEFTNVLAIWANS